MLKHNKSTTKKNNAAFSKLLNMFNKNIMYNEKVFWIY